jgi:Family of unknown function (DUF5754)
MTKLRLVSVTPSFFTSGKKLEAKFSDGKVVHFGATGYEDYTMHKDPERRERYLTRHRDSEHWNDPQTPGCLSRYILWEKTSRSAAVSAFKKRFNL